MLPHRCVHRGRHEHRGGAGKVSRAEKIVRNPDGEFRDDVRGGRSDDKQIGCLRERDVRDRIGIVRSVVVDGRILMNERKLLTLDESEVINRAEVETARLLGRAGLK